MDTVHGSLLTELGAHTRIADWLKKRDFQSHMLAPMYSNAMYVHVMFLLRQRDFTRFVGALEATPHENRNKTAYAGFCLSFLLAVGYALTGKREKAAEHFEQSAEKGLPDGFMIYFSIYSQLFQGLIEELLEELLEKKYPELLDKFNDLNAQIRTDWYTQHNAIMTDALPSDLTAREREIALLAAEGLHNSEISKRLFVSESTVRAHLRTTFQKLDIDRRAKLAEKLK
jgi:LuxR family maltose regulon positive regulatory protein